jgi:hypothetical protein
MRWLLVLLAVSCASTPAFTSRRLEDGSYQLQCATELAVCLGRVEEVCRGRPYDVVSGSDHRKQIDVSVGTYQREIRSSEAVIRCVRNKSSLGDALASSPAKPDTQAPARACVPGATQVCVGPGACSGGQACLKDGSGFGACNCVAAGAAGRPAGDAGID